MPHRETPRLVYFRHVTEVTVFRTGDLMGADAVANELKKHRIPFARYFENTLGPTVLMRTNPVGGPFAWLPPLVILFVLTLFSALIYRCFGH